MPIPSQPAPLAVSRLLLMNLPARAGYFAVFMVFVARRSRSDQDFVSDDERNWRINQASSLRIPPPARRVAPGGRPLGAILLSGQLIADRQASDALASGSEDRIAKCRRKWRQTR